MQHLRDHTEVSDTVPLVNIVEMLSENSNSENILDGNTANDNIVNVDDKITKDNL